MVGITPPDKLNAAFAAFDASEAAATAGAVAGQPDPAEEMPDPFVAYENERASAAIARYIATEYGTLEQLEAALDLEFAGQKGRTPEEMMEWLLQDDEDEASND